MQYIDYNYRQEALLLKSPSLWGWCHSAVGLTFSIGITARNFARKIEETHSAVKPIKCRMFRFIKTFYFEIGPTSDLLTWGFSCSRDQPYANNNPRTKFKHKKSLNYEHLQCARLELLVKTIIWSSVDERLNHDFNQQRPCHNQNKVWIEIMLRGLLAQPQEKSKIKLFG